MKMKNYRVIKIQTNFKIVIKIQVIYKGIKMAHLNNMEIILKPNKIKIQVNRIKFNCIPIKITNKWFNLRVIIQHKKLIKLYQILMTKWLNTNMLYNKKIF